MGLTADVEQSLRDAGLIAFYETHESALAEMAQSSYGYADGYVSAIPLPLRRDDVAKILVPALTTNEPLRDFLAGKKLRQQYWFRHFADLILDRQWEVLHGEETNNPPA